MPTRRVRSAPPPVDTAPDAAEVDSLARELARAYKGMAAFYHDQMKLSVTDADSRARDPLEDAEWKSLETQPADQISWWKLSRLGEHEPETATAVWTRIKELATNELTSGHRAAKVLNMADTPWVRARFLAIRSALIGECAATPTGSELLLIDSAAHAYTLYEEWTELLQQRWHGEYTIERHYLERDDAYKLPQVTHAQAVEQASRLAERYHRLFTQTVKHLQALRTRAGQEALLATRQREFDQHANVLRLDMLATVRGRKRG